MYMDIDHVIDNNKNPSWSVFLILMNTDIIKWFPKKQTTIETYFFGAEFVAMKIVMDMLRWLKVQIGDYGSRYFHFYIHLQQ